MGIFKNDTAVAEFFGMNAYKKLVTILSNCCSSANTCCPTEKYTITAILNGCTINNPKYDVFVNSVVSMDGPIGYTVFASQNGGAFSSKGIGMLPEGIVANGNALINNTSYTSNSTWQLFVIDSRGNWSNTITITTVPC